MNTKSQSGANNLNVEQQFQLLVAGISDYAIYMLSLEGYVISWNAGAQRFKGYLSEEIIGKHFSCFHTPEDQAAGLPVKALQTVLEEGKFEAEGWRVRKDGTRFWASVVIDPIQDRSGKLIGFAKVTRDITDRKAVQDALRESEQRFRMLVQGVTDYAIYMLSPTGEVTNWNAGAERIKGYRRDEIVGQHFSRFYVEEDQASGVPAHALATATKEGRYEREGWRVRKDGSMFWANVVIDAIHDETGKLIGFAKITRDITEKKQAADALEQANAALFQSQKMESLGQLTGGIAHDFNNLLAVLSSGLDVLSMQVQNRSGAKVLESMQRAIERGATLTQQLLSFARRQPLKAEKYNLSKLIGGFEAILRRAGNSLTTFEMGLEPTLRTVLIDAPRLEAALLNIVVNARDAMPNGGRLSITTENVDLGDREVRSLTAGPYVRITVTDTGTGMSSEVAARAFEPFFTTKEIGKGTGLGLSQVYGFILQSGGEVVLTSEFGKGTTISMYFPAIEEATEDMEMRKEDDENTDKVLIVEDEPDVLDVTAELFRSIGYEVLTASNGMDAIDILKRTRDIDVLFTDVMMPNGMSGIELARFTRKLCPAIKVILASGYPLLALKAEHGSLDDFTFMNKPYRLSDLMKKLRAIA
jgi:PAS domain S-box-containing protein